MSELISKELLSEVLGFKVTSIYVAPNLNFIEAQSEYIDKRINIHELEHKCKEWLKKSGTVITVVNHLDCVSCWLSFNDHEKPTGQFVSETEFKAVAKACQWKLDNKKSE